jgi:hypothetical protein
MSRLQVLLSRTTTLPKTERLGRLAPRTNYLEGEPTVSVSYGISRLGWGFTSLPGRPGQGPIVRYPFGIA